MALGILISLELAEIMWNREHNTDCAQTYQSLHRVSAGRAPILDGPRYMVDLAP